MCGSFAIQSEIRFAFLDNRVGIKGNADLTYLVLTEDSFINGSAKRMANISKNRYVAVLNLNELGIHVLAVYLDGIQIPNSPFLFAVTQRSCVQYPGRVADLMGNCVCANIATLDIGDKCISLVMLIVISLVGIFLLFASMQCIRRLMRSEDYTRRMVDDLRVKLRLIRSEGIILSSDPYSIWRHRASVIFIQRSYLEAAARLALFRDDCDVNLLNGLCVCLLERPKQYRLLCDWLLSICGDLLDPRVSFLSRPSFNDSPGWDTSRHMKFQSRRVQNLIDPKVLTQEDRFRYFVDKICKIQALKDTEVFEKLQFLSQNIMDNLAELCDKLFIQLCAEPFGAELSASQFDVVVEGASKSVQERSSGEQLFLIGGSNILRQDSVEVQRPHVCLLL